MHAAVLQLAPVLGAEKSKVPFYVAGGVLVLWALIVALGPGMRTPNFPSTRAAQTVVIAVTGVLVLAAVVTAVITSGGEGKASAESQSTTASSPKATTGTPAPASSPAPNAASTTLKLAANPAGQLSYDTKQLSAKAGKVTIDFSNSSPLEHDVAIAQGSSVAGQTPVFTGGSKTLTLNLKPGTYTFYCTVPGHRQAGMEGTLTVS
jgi:uncharacterized cupredoxin-like copper-binding protein